MPDADKNPATVWHAGDECQDTGRTLALHGATWRILRRLSDGKEILRRADSEIAEGVARVRAEWQDQQAAFRRLRS